MPAITITDLNNAKEDVDHIAALATSTLLEATDRLGQTKPTWAGIAADIEARATGVLNDADSAIGDQVAAATAQADRAEAARDAAQMLAGGNFMKWQKFIGPPPWEITVAPLTAVMFGIINLAHYGADAFTVAAQIVGETAEAPRVAANGVVYIYFV